MYIPHDASRIWRRQHASRELLLLCGNPLHGVASVDRIYSVAQRSSQGEDNDWGHDDNHTIIYESKDVRKQMQEAPVTRVIL
jgi:hypothetical protein